jgi:hypothetical protein
VCAWVSPLLALAAAASLVAMEVIDGRRTTDECADATVALDQLLWVALALSAFALVFGIIGLWSRGGGGKLLSLLGIIGALGVAALILIPSGPGGLGEIGSYVCGSVTPRAADGCGVAHRKASIPSTRRPPSRRQVPAQIPPQPAALRAGSLSSALPERGSCTRCPRVRLPYRPG